LPVSHFQQCGHSKLEYQAYWSTEKLNPEFPQVTRMRRLLMFKVHIQADIDVIAGADNEGGMLWRVLALLEKLNLSQKC